MSDSEIDSVRFLPEIRKDLEPTREMVQGLADRLFVCCLQLGNHPTEGTRLAIQSVGEIAERLWISPPAFIPVKKRTEPEEVKA